MKNALVWIFSFLIILAGCSGDSKNVSGGVTDIGNSVASGVVLDVAGSPVKKARVVAYYDSWNKSAIADSVQTWTDGNGRYELQVDSSASYVLLASSGKNSGFAQQGAEDSSGAVITIGPAKMYSGQIANRHTGSVRIVGSNFTTSLDADGYFIFYEMPRGDITLAYSDWDVQARIQFTTTEDREIYVLPKMNFHSGDSSWLVVDRKEYYGDEGFDGIRIREPSGVEEDPTLAYLGMDGTEIVRDNDSTLAASVDYVVGIVDSAVLLKPGQFIDLDTLDPCVGDFTISLWTKWEGPNGNHQILASQRAYWSDSTSRFQWHFEEAEGKFMILKSLPAYPEGFAFGDSSIVPVGEWSNLVLVSENSKVSMYVNGEVVEMKDEEGKVFTAREFVPNTLDRSVPLRIGGNEIDTETWNGALDEIRIERVARSGEWIREYYLKNISTACN
ncbi:MAG: LamG domain-containing protein [Fibrobacter sp.]|nr:LamG domain-containing protein [Fibrobacter sp.]